LLIYPVSNMATCLAFFFGSDLRTLALNLESSILV
jgi:hypothetical protein